MEGTEDQTDSLAVCAPRPFGHGRPVAGRTAGNGMYCRGPCLQHAPPDRTGQRGHPVSAKTTSTIEPDQVVPVLLDAFDERGCLPLRDLHARQFGELFFKLGQGPVLSLAVGHGLHLETVFDEAFDCLVEAFQQLAARQDLALLADVAQQVCEAAPGAVDAVPARIFRFANMRQSAINRLIDIKKRHPIRFLGYPLHPDGYRILVEAEHPGRISKALRSFHLGTTHDSCSRKDRDGPVWRQRGTAVTLVRNGPRALRCALDMDFVMMRGDDEDLFHPLLWKHSGHLELSEVRKRYRITDRDAIRRRFMDTPWPAFREWCITASTDRWNSNEFGPEPWWRTAPVVGSQRLCESIADTSPTSWLDLKVHPPLGTVQGLEKTMCRTVNMERKRTREYIRSLVPEA